MAANEDKANQLLAQLSRTSGLSLVEVARIARALMWAMVDPIQATGETFLFESELPRWTALGNLGGDFNLHIVNSRVPPPDAIVDLGIAVTEFSRDCRHCTEILALPHPPAHVLRQISLNQCAWAEFWAVRHPHPAMREYFATAATKGRAAMATNNEKAERLLATLSSKGAA